jgi:CBS domain-containing protein
MMKIKDVMTRDVEVARPSETLQNAAQRMKDLDVGSLPVCDGQRVVGMITDRDMTVVATAEGTDPAKTVVGDVMTPEPVFCFEDQPVEAAAALMEERQLRRLIVLNRDKQLVGIFSIGDLAEKADDQILSGQVLQKVSEPEGEGAATAQAPKPAKVPNIPSETHL